RTHQKIGALGGAQSPAAHPDRGHGEGPRRQCCSHRRPVRRDQGAARRILPDRGPGLERGDPDRRGLSVGAFRQRRGAADLGDAAGCRFGAPPNDYSIEREMTEATLRFMVLVKASKDSEAGVMPSRELLTAMGKFNEELAKAGVLVAGEGLHPRSKGARVRFSGSKRTVIDGPFAETKELIAGFWIWQVKSRDEAIEWVKRCPNPHNEECEVEIRQIFEAEDFGDALTPEMRAKEERMRVGSKERANKKR